LLERVIATLSNAFGLIKTQASLSRDLGALLPNFFTALLNLFNQPPLLLPILTALHKLIPEHPTIFRPNVARTSTLILSLLDGSYPRDVQLFAALVYVDLHHSAQKGTNAEHWRAGFLGAIGEVHLTLDCMFNIIEEGSVPISWLSQIPPRFQLRKDSV
jgi:pre-rRNA-processing protein RIX1